MRRLTIERSTVIILFALLFALAARVPVDTDTWWHLRSAEYTRLHGMIHTDPFSFTLHGQPWINHSWGAQLILEACWRVGGMLGLTVYMAGLATAGMYFVFRASAGSTYLRAFAVVLGAAAAAVFWSPRPQMLSFFLSAVVLYLLFRFKAGNQREVWLIPPIMAVWGNLHAGFSIGFIFMLALIAGETLNRLLRAPIEPLLSWRKIGLLALVGLVSAAAVCINPYFIAILRVPFETVGIGALREFIQEWNAPNFAERQTWPFLALLISVAAALLISRRPIDWTHVLLAAGTGYMALTAGRNIAVFAVAATPILTIYLDALLTARGIRMQPMRAVSPRMGRLNAALVGVVLFAAVMKTLLVLDSELVETAMNERLPVEAAAHLAETTPAGPMFNSYNWGGYLMYARPEEPVFVDGRTDLYGDAFLRRWLATTLAQDGWRETLAEYGIRFAIIETGSGLANQLRAEPGWRLDYEDPLASVFVREGA